MGGESARKCLRSISTSEIFDEFTGIKMWKLRRADMKEVGEDDGAGLAVANWGGISGDDDLINASEFEIS